MGGDVHRLPGWRAGLQLRRPAGERARAGQGARARPQHGSGWRKPLTSPATKPAQTCLSGSLNGFNLLAALSAPALIFPPLGLGGLGAEVGLIWVPAIFSTLFLRGAARQMVRPQDGERPAPAAQRAQGASRHGLPAESGGRGSPLGRACHRRCADCAGRPRHRRTAGEGSASEDGGRIRRRSRGGGFGADHLSLPLDSRRASRRRGGAIRPQARQAAG